MKVRILRFERFDFAVLATIAGCALAIAMVVGQGDHVGLSIQRFEPTNTASSRAIIRITADDVLSSDSVQARFSITPPTPGKLAVNGNQITFQPSQAYVQGQEYMITLRAGVQSSTGRTLKHDVEWAFRVNPPRIAYLAPADSLVQNLYMLDPALSDVPIQLTTSAHGVIGYDPSPDGGSIVYAALQDKAAASLYVVDLADRVSKLLYACNDAKCSSPVFRPDGGAVAFERIELNTGTGMASGVTRVWTLDLTTNTARPLFADNQQLGYSPRWSPDGTRLAVFNFNAGGIVVHDFSSGEDTIIPTLQGGIGQFSPDGRWLNFPMLVKLGDGREVTHLALADVTTSPPTLTDLQPTTDANDDREAAWMSDSKRLLVTRPGLDAQGATALQIYSLDVATGKFTPVVADPSYSQSNLQLSPAGDMVLFQRFPVDKFGGQMEIWMDGLNSGETRRMVENAAVPRWIP